MKSTTFAVSVLSIASLATARSINKARADTRHGFELDVTSDSLGLQDYYSREDGFVSTSKARPSQILAAKRTIPS